MIPHRRDYSYKHSALFVLDDSQKFIIEPYGSAMCIRYPLDYIIEGFCYLDRFNASFDTNVFIEGICCSAVPSLWSINATHL